MTTQQVPPGKKLNAAQMKTYKGGWWWEPGFDDLVNNCRPSDNACDTFLQCSFPNGCTSTVRLYIDCIGGACVVLEGFRP